MEYYLACKQRSQRQDFLVFHKEFFAGYTANLKDAGIFPKSYVDARLKVDSNVAVIPCTAISDDMVVHVVTKKELLHV